MALIAIEGHVPLDGHKGLVMGGLTILFTGLLK